jgi:CRISPR-associated protein Cas1
MGSIGERTRSLPIESISHLVLLGEARLNSRLLTLCGKHGVRVSVFDFYGYCIGIITGYCHET